MLKQWVIWKRNIYGNYVGTKTPDIYQFFRMLFNEYTIFQVLVCLNYQLHFPATLHIEHASTRIVTIEYCACCYHPETELLSTQLGQKLSWNYSYISHFRRFQKYLPKIRTFKLWILSPSTIENPWFPIKHKTALQNILQDFQKKKALKWEKYDQN